MNLDLKATIKINGMVLLAWSFFWVYGFYAAIYFGEPDAAITVTGLLTILFVALVWLGRGRWARRFNCHMSIRDVGMFVLFLTVLVGFGWKQLNSSLATDQFYHSGMAFVHAQRLLQHDLLPDSSQIATALQQHAYWVILYGINAAIMALAILSFVTVQRIKSAFGQAIAAALMFASWRLLVDSYVTHGDIHPPFRLFLLNASTMLFGINEFAVRVPGLIGIALFQCLLVQKLETRFGLLVAVLAGLATGTAPLLWHCGSLVEVSIWSGLAFCSITLLVLDSEREDAGDLDFGLIYTLLALASLIRQSAFIAVIPILAFQLSDQVKRKRPVLEALKIMTRDGSPMLVMVPWTLFVIHTGTPVSDHSGIPLYIRIQDAWNEFAFLKYLSYGLGPLWSGLFFLGFIPFGRRSVAFSLTMLLVILGLFYSIVPSAWGQARYQAEIGMPLAMLGLIRLVDLVLVGTVKMGRGAFKAIAGLGLVVCTIVNIWQFRHIRKVEGVVDNSTYVARSQEGSVPSLAELPFAFDAALADARRHGLGSGLFIDGVTYGVMPEILAGYNFSEVRADMLMPTAWGGANPAGIDQYPAIRSVLLADWSYVQNLKSIEYLTSRGWQLVGTYPDVDAKANILYLLKRP